MWRPKHEPASGIRILGVFAREGSEVLQLQVLSERGSRVQALDIDPEFAAAIREVCDRRPFKWRRFVDEYSYWIDGFGHTETFLDSQQRRIQRSDPRICVMIR